ncbi:maltotransferase domain-containing protein, partial [Gaiella sp.]|uniref:maltotransferase domain-containing protein n=1 Tax=Gaiella sp. TaxID=2663207 RepID=UPI003C723688
MTVPGARRTVYRVPKVAAERIYVTDVTPQVDCGRWPAKACVGDRVEVDATITRDGHEALRGVVRYRRPRGR